MHVGDLLVNLLQQMGVDTVFGVPGAQTLPFYDGIDNTAGKIKHITLRAERSAAYAAVAYARVMNRVGVCDATVGPGAAEFTSGLGEAYNSSTPIFALFSDLPLGWEHLRDHGNASQGFYQLDMVKPFTKWTGSVTTQKALPDMLRNAFIKAVSGRPGPTALSIPEDVFQEEWAGELPQMPADLSMFPRYRTVASREQIEKALTLLVRAKRPVLVVGGGAMLSQAEAEVTALAEHMTMPVLQTFTGRGVIPDDHPLGIGMMGGVGTLSAKKLIEEADVIFFAGFKSSQNSTFNWKLPNDGQHVIHLDLDESEIGRAFHAEVGLVGDVKTTLAEMTKLAKEKFERPPHQDREQWIQNAKKDWASFIQKELTENNSELKPQQVIDVLNQVSGQEDILVCDASFSSGWGAVYYNLKSTGRKVLAPRGLAGLGFGLPAAIGAAAAAKNGEVYLLAGDGGFGYSIGELATLKQYGLKVITFVLDNRSWGWIEWLNKLNYQKEYFGLPAIEFAKIAEGFGLKGYHVRNKAELADALANAKKDDNSSVIHIDIALWETPVISFREAVGQDTSRSYKYL
ncbi:acetolactate synthase large subunit [Paradesulfitobacterium aromaticivorans]